MNRSLLIAALLSLAAFSREGTSAPAAAPPAAEMIRTASSQAPAQEQAPSGIPLPAFTFRTRDGQSVKAQINGEDLSTTPRLWSITQSLTFTAAAIPRDWPP